MEVVRAGVLGFCGGVRRAVAMIEEAADGCDPIYTLHAIVHNEHVMARLRERGVILVDSLAEIPDNAFVALTAHGAPLMTIAALRARDLNLIDTTCPIVRDAQRTVADNAKSGRFTIVFGDRDHLEVRGLLSHAVGCAVAAESMDGLELPSESKLAIVGQTTKSPEALQAFAEDLISLLGEATDVIVQDTTCGEPVARYLAARELANKADVLVVVGSPTSANTRNLYEICESSGRPATFIESAEDIDPSAFGQYTHIGLTAGASTPDWLIDSVEQRFHQL